MLLSGGSSRGRMDYLKEPGNPDVVRVDDAATVVDIG